MVARNTGSGGACAPGPAPTEIYRPGDLVKYRTAGDGVPALVRALGGDPAAVFVVTAVVREEQLHGLVVYYRVAAGGRCFSVNPAAVTRIDPPAGPAPAAAPAPPAAPEPPPPDALRWVAVASNVDRSPDGRFEVETTARNLHVARDLWTSEATGQLANRYSAEEWCRARTEVPPLAWADTPAGWAAETRRGERFTVSNEPYGWVADDRRLSAVQVGPGVQPAAVFEFADDAKAWCEVRAACAVDGTGPGATLRYQPPIPF